MSLLEQLAVDDATHHAATRMATDWACERRRRMHELHPEGLTADQVADLRLMRWFDEARLLGPAHLTAVAATRGVRL